MADSNHLLKSTTNTQRLSYTKPAEALKTSAKECAGGNDPSEKEHKLAELTTSWEAMLASEEEAFRRYYKLKRRKSAESEKASLAACQWWKSVNSVLSMFSRTKAEFDYDLRPFPMDVLERLAEFSAETAKGNIPSIVENARDVDRPEDGLVRPQ